MPCLCAVFRAVGIAAERGAGAEAPEGKAVPVESAKRLLAVL
jgi:hypothetical protein